MQNTHVVLKFSVLFIITIKNVRLVEFVDGTQQRCHVFGTRFVGLMIVYSYNLTDDILTSDALLRYRCVYIFIALHLHILRDLFLVRRSIKLHDSTLLFRVLGKCEIKMKGRKKNFKKIFIRVCTFFLLIIENLH